MNDPVDSPIGHNGGPPLDEPVAPGRPQCKWCRHWQTPSGWELRAYETFRLGLSRRRVKRPSGTCDRVLLPGRKSTVFSATSAEFGCLNFEAKPLPARPAGGGFVTIWRNGRVAWQGAGENIPPRFLQDILGLGLPDDGGQRDDAS